MGHSLFAAIGLGAVVALACTPRTAAEASSAPTVGRGEDASSLPTFSDPQDADAAAPIERFRVELGDAPIRGTDDAPVTIVMFSDFECPYCLQGHRTMHQIAEAYGAKVRFAYKPYPLPIHSNAIIAALAARSAQKQGRFWPFHDRLYQQEGLDFDTLVRYAEEAGMDVKALTEDIATLSDAPSVTKDMRQARRLGVDSTPTFFINGRELSGAQPLEAFAAVIDDEVARAKRWAAEGIAPDQIYAHAIAEGFTKVEFRQGRRGIDPDGVFPVPIGDSPTLGRATAPITIVSFSDFQCPFCVRGHETLTQVRKLYGDKVRVVHKHSPLPFHSYAFLAARASVAAQQQEKFWPFLEGLYGLKAKFDEATIMEVAKNAGLDMKRFAAQMNDLELDRSIEEDQRLASALGVNGTPAFFINGRPLQGAQPTLQFRLLIEEELERAGTALASGVAPEDLYETLTHQPL